MANGSAAFEQADVEVGHAAEPHLTFLDQPQHFSPRIFDGGTRLVWPMELVKINALNAEPAQRRLALGADGFRLEDSLGLFHRIPLVPNQARTW